MPSRPPVFRPPGWRERKPWAPADGQPDRRKRGRAGVRERRQVITEEPLCRHCLERGLRVASEFVDHIIPLAWARFLPCWLRPLLDERWNKQGLCGPCHDAKSLRERSGGPPADLLAVAERLRAAAADAG